MLMAEVVVQLLWPNIGPQLVWKISHTQLVFYSWYVVHPSLHNQTHCYKTHGSRAQ